MKYINDTVLRKDSLSRIEIGHLCREVFKFWKWGKGTLPKPKCQKIGKNPWPHQKRRKNSKLLDF